MSQRTLLEARDDVQWTQEVRQAFGATLVGRIVTTDAAPTTLITVTLVAATTTLLRVLVVARRTSGGAGTDEDGAGYLLAGAYNLAGGVATALDGVTPAVLFVSESQVGWDATLTVSGKNVIITVTGAADNTITWAGKVQLETVSI